MIRFLMVRLTVKVVPDASRNRIVGRYGEGIKVQVSAPPEKGKANEAVVAVLAEALQLSKSQIALIAGHAQPRKTFHLSGITNEQLQRKLAEFQ